MPVNYRVIENTIVRRRISSGDNGAPLDPPMTPTEIAAGGRLEEFDLVILQASDGASGTFTFTAGTSNADKKARITNWYMTGKVAAPMLSASHVPGAEEWSI